MLLIFPILVLILSASILWVLSMFRVRVNTLWMLATLGSLSSWGMMIYLGTRLPQNFTLLEWQSGPQGKIPLQITLSSTTYPFALGILTVVTAVLMTLVARRPPYLWDAWASSLAFGAVGLLATTADNPLTIAITWTALDLLELGILIRFSGRQEAFRGTVSSLAARIGGTAILLFATLLARSQEGSAFIASAPPALSPLLLLALVMRVRILPQHLPFVEAISLRRGLGTALRLIPAAASLAFLSRLTERGPALHFNELPWIGLTILAGASAVYGAVRWAAANHEENGRQFWILSTVSLSILAALQANLHASLAWGMICLLPGSSLFLYSARRPGMRIILLLGALSLSTLPFTPAAQAVLRAPPMGLTILLWLTQGLLLAGYLRLAWMNGEEVTHQRWIWAIYPLGLVLPLGVHWGLSLQNIARPAGIEAWGGAAPLGIAALLGIANRRGLQLPQRWQSLLESAFSFGWLSRLAGGAFTLLNEIIRLISRVLEGDGGLLWAIILLAVLAAWVLGSSAP
jgi:hypothetical protein